MPRPSVPIHPRDSDGGDLGNAVLVDAVQVHQGVEDDEARRDALEQRWRFGCGAAGLTVVVAAATGGPAHAAGIAALVERVEAAQALAFRNDT